MVNIFLLLYSLSTNQYDLYEKKAQNSLAVIKYFTICDIFFNIVCEHYQDLEVEKFLKKSMMIYFKTTFFADFSNLLGLYIIDWEF